MDFDSPVFCRVSGSGLSYRRSLVILRSSEPFSISNKETKGAPYYQGRDREFSKYSTEATHRKLTNGLSGI